MSKKKKSTNKQKQRKRQINKQKEAERKRKKAKTKAAKQRKQAVKAGKTAASHTKSTNSKLGLRTNADINRINRAAQAGRRYAEAQQRALEKQQRQRLRNERSNKRLTTAIGHMMEGKKSALDRKGGDVAALKGLATLYYYESYWRGAGSEGMKNWTEHAVAGYAAEHNMNPNDVNLWSIAKNEMMPKLNARLLEVMDDDGLVEYDEYGTPMYKGSDLRTTDDIFQAMLDSGLYTPSDIVAIVRGIR